MKKHEEEAIRSVFLTGYVISTALKGDRKLEKQAEDLFIKFMQDDKLNPMEILKEIKKLNLNPHGDCRLSPPRSSSLPVRDRARL